MLKKDEGSDDLRVRRTRKLLQEAMIQLTVEKGFNAVTVRDITERAMVNRSTFYRHYLDKYDLIDQYMEEIGNLTSEEDFTAEKQAQLKEGVSLGLMRLLEHVQRFADFYKVMLGQNGDARFTDRFRKNTEKRFRANLENSPLAADPNAPPVDLKLKYISSAGVGAILWWLENDQPCSAEQLARWLGQLGSASAGVSWRRK